MFKIFLFALLIFLNCGGDKTSLVEVESDPAEPLWGYWFGSSIWESGVEEWGLVYYEKIFVFQQNGKVLERTKVKNDLEEIIFPWATEFDSYTYDVATKFLTFSYDDYPYDLIISYNGGSSFRLDWGVSENVLFTKQDTLPDWAE